MAVIPNFGGTNGVPVLDLGQPGSARAGSDKAAYGVRVTRLDEDDGTVVHKLTDQAVSFAEATGFRGQRIVWAGNLKVVDVAELTAIRSHLTSFRTGQTVDAGGIRSAIDPALMGASTLTDTLEAVITPNAKIVSVVFGEIRKLTADATFGYLVPLRITFGVLG